MGLGCRSGGYMVYLIIALGLLLIEIFVWWLTHQTTHTSEDILAKVGTRLERRLSRSRSFDVNKKSRLQKWLDAFLSWVTSNTFRDVMKNFVLRPGEVINAAWLVYIVMAQSVQSPPFRISMSIAMLTKSV